MTTPEQAPVVRRMAHLAGRGMAIPLSYGLLRLRRRGDEHIPADGGVLLVANHVANLDPLLVATAALPRVTYFMAKAELFRVPVLTRLITSQGAFPVDRGNADRSAMRISRDILGRGDTLLMFPEGTRSGGVMHPPQPGAGTLALLPGVTVVPAAVWGSQRRFGPVRVAFGPPIDMSDLTEGPRGARARRAAHRMMVHIAGLVPTVGGPVQRVPPLAVSDG